MSGSFDVKITKGILGESRFTGILGRLYRTYGNIPDRAFPIAEYYVDLTVKSSAECSFEGGGGLYRGSRFRGKAEPAGRGAARWLQPKAPQYHHRVQQLGHCPNPT
ncbi:hypothetical protein [Aeromonas veronii]|uniref:hypothetical protein n=1 Tax=Aeromonas veronii TaxID=654 RepID=UPI0032EDA76E